MSQNIPNSLFLQALTDQAGFVDQVSAWGQALTNLLTNAVFFVSGTHQQRLAVSAANYDAGSFFLETDRLLLYISFNGQWFYALGLLTVTQADLPADLQANDLHLRVNVSDFAHELNWNGKGWQWAPSEHGSGMVEVFLNPPNPGAGWQLCDGTANVPNLNGDGSLSFATLPNTPGSYYRQ